MEGTSGIVIFIFLGSTAMAGMAFAVVLYVVKYQKKLLEQKIELQEIENRKQSELFRATIEAEERQKAIIARNLHDTVSANLFQAKHIISLGKADPGLNDSLDLLEKLVGTAMEQIREACFDLIPQTLKTQGFLKALEELNYNLARSLKLKPDFSISGSATLLMHETFQSILFRALQEVYKNIAAHSKPKSLSTKVKIQEGGLSISITYEGQGITSSEVASLSGKGLGLNSIASRLNMIDGQIQYHGSNGIFGCSISVPANLSGTEMAQ